MHAGKRFDPEVIKTVKQGYQGENGRELMIGRRMTEPVTIAKMGVHAGTHLSIENGKTSSSSDSLSIFLKALSTADLISSRSIGFIA